MNNTKINAVVVADSINPYGNRITSLLVTMPRIILAEFNTHRMFSRNTSSSRAIPFNKMVEAVQNNPFIPIAWQKDHKGMQGNEYYTNEVDIQANIIRWNAAKERAIKYTIGLNEQGVTKQLCNRLLEPFQWCTSLVTATEYDNFFELRCPIYSIETEKKITNYKSKKDFIQGVKNTYKDNWDLELRDWYGLKDYDENFNDIQWFKLNSGKAEIHLMELAECMWDARNESTPKQLKIGEWHIPFEDKIDIDFLWAYYVNSLVPTEEDKERGAIPIPTKEWFEQLDICNDLKVKVATSFAARTSYTVVGNEKEFSIKNHIDLHNKLISSVPIHGSPMEHCAKVPTDKEYYYNIKGEGFDTHDDALGFHPESYGWFDNFHGYIPYRKLLENETSI